MLQRRYYNHNSLTFICNLPYLRVHDYCMSAKYSRAFVLVRSMYPSANEQCKHVSPTASYVCSQEQVCLHCDNPSSRLLVKPSIYTEELAKITEQSSRSCRKIYVFSTWSSTCSSKSVTTLSNAHCFKIT